MLDTVAWLELEELLAFVDEHTVLEDDVIRLDVDKVVT